MLFFNSLLTPNQRTVFRDLERRCSLRRLFQSTSLPTNPRPWLRHKASPPPHSLIIARLLAAYSSPTSHSPGIARHPRLQIRDRCLICKCTDRCLRCKWTDRSLRCKWTDHMLSCKYRACLCANQRTVTSMQIQALVFVYES